MLYDRIAKWLEDSYLKKIHTSGNMILSWFLNEDHIGKYGILNSKMLQFSLLI